MERKWWRETDVVSFCLPFASQLPSNEQEVKGKDLTLKISDSGVGWFLVV